MKPEPDNLKSTNESGNFSEKLNLLKKHPDKLIVPDGYFDSLNSRIIDNILINQNSSFIKRIINALQKPIVWAPSVATASAAIILLFIIPTTQTRETVFMDEWAEINSVYDASYASEVLFAESFKLEKEIEDFNNKDILNITEGKELTDEEITTYLNDQVIDLNNFNNN